MKLKNLMINCLAVALVFTSLVASPARKAVVDEMSCWMEDANTTVCSATRGEETKWKYRTVDGKIQRRLWSITYGIWLTEWEWV